MINYKGPLNYEDFKAQFLDNSDYDAENVGWNGIPVTVLNLLLQILYFINSSSCHKSIFIQRSL